MKVLLINGSPHKEGCTYTALSVISQTLKEEQIDSEIYQVGTNIEACRACYACSKIEKCVIKDSVNDFIEYAKQFDGYIIGSPVHYASVCGNLVSFLHRAFFAASRQKEPVFKHKPASAIASARRAGTTVTIDQLNKYFQINQMPIISGRYWNMVHGSNKEEVLQDKEGIQNMQILARNFAYYLKCIEIGKKQGILPPKTPEVIYTNFIR